MKKISRFNILAFFAAAWIFAAAPSAVKAENLIPYSDSKGHWGYCDESSAVKIKPKYEAAWQFKNGMGIAFTNPYTVFISSSGTEILRGRWQNVKYPDEHGIPVKLRGYWGYADKKGEMIFPAEYEEFYNFSGNSAPAKKNGLWGIADISTKEFRPCGCDEIKPYSEGYAVFLKNGKYGLIDENGNEALPPAYEELYPFSAGFATARLDGKYGLITTKLLFKIRDYIRLWPYSEGYAAATSLDSENKCGYIDNSGIITIPFQYAECLPFSEGKAAVRKNKGGKLGYIDSSGKELTKFKYDYAYPFANGAAWTVIKEKGIWINEKGRPFDKYFRLKKIRDMR